MTTANAADRGHSRDGTGLGEKWNAAALSEIRAHSDRPVLFTGARVCTGDPVIGDFDSADVLLGGDVVVGVGPGLLTAAGDDSAIVVDCAGLTIIPGVLDSLAVLGFRPARKDRVATLVPGNAADLAILPTPLAATPRLAAELLLGRPAETTALVAGGRVVRWGGVDVVAPSETTQHTPHAQSLAGDAHLGVWVDDSDFLHQELTADGRYDETRGGREHAFQGQFWIEGDRIDYLDDLGFWAYGQFTGDRLDHAGYSMRLR